MDMSDIDLKNMSEDAKWFINRPALRAMRRRAIELKKVAV
jgi:hypothetical protein